MGKWTRKKIRTLRKGLGLTQKEFGKRLGVSLNYIYLLEAGERTPSDTLQLLLDRVKKEGR